MSRQPFTARYPAVCYECSEPIVPGDKIVGIIEERCYWHADCDRTPEPKEKTIKERRYGKK